MGYANGRIDFAIFPENLDSSLIDLWAVNLVAAAASAVDSSEESRLNCLVGLFDLEDGVLREQSLLLDTSNMSVGGSVGSRFQESATEGTPRTQGEESGVLQRGNSSRNRRGLRGVWYRGQDHGHTPVRGRHGDEHRSRADPANLRYRGNEGRSRGVPRSPEAGAHSLKPWTRTDGAPQAGVSDAASRRRGRPYRFKPEDRTLPLGGGIVSASARHRMGGEWFAIALLLAWTASPVGAETGALPNILLITVDTLRPDHLGAYGHTRARTPAVDSIARISVRFTQAITPFPRTTPALASLMTGLWPQHHGSREVSDPFTNGITLAQVLLNNGYSTFGVSANWVASRKQNMQQGFLGFISMKRMQTDDRARFVTDRALALSALAPESQPLFLWTHYMDPHYPYNPRESDEQTPPGTACKEAMRAVSKKRLRLAAIQGNRDGMGERILGDCVQLYDAEIAYMDTQLRRLLKGLENQGRLENVIIVFTADHGEAFGEAGLFFEHGSTVHDANLNVPLLITAPGVTPGVDDGLIRLEDLMPTILSLAGLRSHAPPTDGLDQSWRLEGGPRPAKAKDVVALAESGTALLIGAYSQPFEGPNAGQNCVHGPRYSLCTLPKNGTGLYDRLEDPKLTVDVSAAHPDDLSILRAARERWQLGEARQRAARGSRFKLVESPRLEGGYARALYDLEQDPAESRNVIDEHPEIAAQLGQELAAWSASIPSQAPPPERDEEQLEMLRALGYVE